MLGGGIKGGGYFSVYNTGIELDVPYSDEETSETESGSKGNPASHSLYSLTFS